MAAPAISDQATKNNQRLFKRYAQIFQNPDASNYDGHAQKFSVWLSDHKAYYVSARPEIIKLLLVAQGTLRRALHIPEDLSVPFNVYDYPSHPLIPPYILLVKSILPFESMFMEPSLIAHIRRLRDTITPRQANTAGPSHPQSNFSASFSPSGESQSVNNLGKNPAVTVSSASPFDPDIQVIEHRTQPSPVTGNVPFSDSDIQIIEQGIKSLPIIEQDIKSLPIMNVLPFAEPDIQIIENPNLPLSAPPVSRQSPAQLHNTPPATATAPVRKVKKRKTLNLEALAQTDVQSLLPKKQTSLQPPKDAPGVDSPTLQLSPSTPSNAHQENFEPQRPAPTHSEAPVKVPELEQATVIENVPIRSSPRPEAINRSMSGIEVADIKPTILEQSVTIIDATVETSRSLKVEVASSNGTESVVPPHALAPSENTQALEMSVEEASASLEIPMEVDNLQVTKSQEKTISQVSKQPMDVEIIPQFKVVDEERRPNGGQEGHLILVEPQTTPNNPPITAISDTVPSVVEPDSDSRAPIQSAEKHQTQQLMVPVLNVAKSSNPMEMSTPEPANRLLLAPSQHTNVSTIEMDIAPPAAEDQRSALSQPPNTSDIEVDTSQATTLSPLIQVDKHSSIVFPTPSPPLPISKAPTAPTLQEQAVVNGTLSQTSTTPIVRQTPIMSSPKGVFTSDMRVAAVQKGMKERRRIHFQFDIPEAQFHLVLIWIGRSKFNSIQEIQSSICLSLGCYLTTDLDELSKKADCDTFEKQVSFARSVWPSDNKLVMNIQLEGTRQDLPLAPPLQVTPDNLVDISTFLSVGKNCIELSQYEDLSQYTFVLHAHYPTQAQIHYWEEQHRKNKEWDDWIQYMSRPLNVNIPRNPTLA